MKSTYKLIGVYWDHTPLPKNEVTLVAYDPTYLTAGSPLCLFDLLEKKRRIDITELLAVDSDLQFQTMVDSFSGCDKVAVVLDYQPSCRGSVLHGFYALRVLQAYGKLAYSLSNTRVTLMLPGEAREAS